MTPDAIDRLRLARAEGIGPITFRRLLRRYGSAAAALAVVPELARAGGRRNPVRIPTALQAAREAEEIAHLGGRMLFLDQAEYPPLLALLEDPPPVLAMVGDPAILSARAVALVGARNASANGLRLAADLAGELARAGLVVVSGLARGIDAAAHRGALAAGRTIAAIAGGLDRPYPRENEALQAEIAAGGGAVVAEAPLGTAPQARHFPRRNRVIAGLSLGVVVVEAAQRSGSLITARLAQEASRELFAAPGSPLDPRCRGSNDLIRQGAHLTETAADVLANLPDHPGRAGLGRDPLFRSMPLPTRDETAPVPMIAPESVGELDSARRQVAELLGRSPVAVDDLLRHCQFSPAAVMAVLLELELAGRVETLSGNRVALIGDEGS